MDGRAERAKLVKSLLSKHEQEGMGLSAEQLQFLFVQEGVANGGSWVALNEYSGTKGVAASINTSLTEGITEETSIPARIRLYGDNHPTPELQPSFFTLLWNTLDDTSLRLLIFAGLISLCAGLYRNIPHGWIEALAVLVAVIIVLLITSINDYMKDKQFRRYTSREEDAKCSVIRMKIEREMLTHDLLVGDIVRLKPGMIVPADGLLVEGFELKVEETMPSGEKASVFKTEFASHDQTSNPFLLCGSRVEEGRGTILVCAVGKRTSAYSFESSNAASLDFSNTPLQNRLEAIADNIGGKGFWFSLLIFLVMLTYVIIDWVRFGWTEKSFEGLMNSVMISVSVLVVAIPEGLPVAVVVSLAYSLGKMKDGNTLVKTMHACETMGSVTDFCTDKTGILTTNSMTAPSWKVFGQPETDEFLKKVLVDSLVVNSDASIVAKGNQVERRGNRTDYALLELARKWDLRSAGEIKKDINLLTQVPFSSSLRYMCTVASRDNETFVFVKGAPEIVLEMCKNEYIDRDNMPVLDQERKKALREGIFRDFEKEALRTIALAYKQGQFTSEDYLSSGRSNTPFLTSNLTLLGIIGVQDKIREDASKALQSFLSAGINVRMISNDSLETAITIARKSGLLSPIFLRKKGSFTVMEGDDFEKAVGELREVTAPDGSTVWKVADLYRFTAIANELKVLARCRPRQKFMLITGLREMENKVVAVTGKGANDVPALKRADVSLALGGTGTQLAKNAADIVLLDDNLSSVVNALKWGRNVYDSVKKFMQFQLTASLAALTLCLVGVIATGKSPLNAVQLLWINLVIDTFAALALATDSPGESVLGRRPIRRSELLIDDVMKKTIAVAFLYQTTVLMVLLFSAPKMLGILPTAAETEWSEEGHIHFTMIFTSFVYMQLGNEVNCRKLKQTDRNLCQGICSNCLFLFVIVLTAGVQVALVEYGGEAVGCARLTPERHIICIAAGIGSLLFGFLSRLVPVYFFSWIQINEPERLQFGHSLLYSMMRRDVAKQVGTGSLVQESRVDSQDDSPLVYAVS